MIQVMVNNDMGFDVSTDLLSSVVRQILADHGVSGGEVSIAIVDDPTIHGLNRDHLQHDYPTDVLSFLLDREDASLEGEIIVSADTAAERAGEFGWSAREELLLYVIHGALHLVDYDDHCDEDRRSMRHQESHYLDFAGCGLPQGRYKETSA